MTRLEAIRDIRSGWFLKKSFIGHKVKGKRAHNYTITIQGLTAWIDCKVMKKEYVIRLSPKQLLSYIKLHYPTKENNNGKSTECVISFDGREWDQGKRHASTCGLL